MSAKSPLTKMEARSLREAAKKPRLGAPIAKDAGRLEVKPATARRLVAKGFARISAGRLIVTPEGHRVLKEPDPHHAVYLTARGGTLTDRLELAMRDEPEVIDPDTLKATIVTPAGRGELDVDAQRWMVTPESAAMVGESAASGRQQT